MKKSLLYFFALSFAATTAQAASVYTLTESFGNEKLIIEFQGTLVNAGSTLIKVTEVDKVFINGVAASNNNNPSGFSESFSSGSSANAQIDLINPTLSNFNISETGTSLSIGQTYNTPFFQIVITPETGTSTLFQPTTISSNVGNGGPHFVPEPSSIAILIIGLGVMIRNFCLRFRDI